MWPLGLLFACNIPWTVDVFHNLDFLHSHHWKHWTLHTEFWWDTNRNFPKEETKSISSYEQNKIQCWHGEMHYLRKIYLKGRKQFGIISSLPTFPEFVPPDWIRMSHSDNLYSILLFQSRWCSLFHLVLEIRTLPSPQPTKPCLPRSALWYSDTENLINIKYINEFYNI
jgi:hypothetical protein